MWVSDDFLNLFLSSKSDKHAELLLVNCMVQELREYYA